MDIRQLHIFVAVAEELNFRRAAARCHIAQPALTRRIQGLERELGVQLFTRTKRSVVLTAPGELFLAYVRGSLAALEKGVREVRRSGGIQDRLVVGFVGYANFPFVPRAFRLFTERMPEVRLEQRELYPAQQLEALSKGELDLGLLGMPAVGEREPELLTFTPLVQSRWRLALPAGHPLAAYEEVDVRALAGLPLILFPRFINPGLYDWVVHCLTKADVVPRIVQEPAQLHGALSLVAAGVGVLPSPFFLDDQRRADVVLRPLAGFGPGAQISAAYRTKDDASPLRALLEVLRGVVKEQSASA